MLFTKLKTHIQINLIIQCIGMLIGTTTHLLWIIGNGFLSENYRASFFSTLFWDALTFLDLIAAALLILKPKAGLWLTAAILVADILHNGSLCFKALWEETEPLSAWFKTNWMFWCQLGFAVFVLLSFSRNRKELTSR